MGKSPIPAAGATVWHNDLAAVSVPPEISAMLRTCRKSVSACLFVIAAILLALCSQTAADGPSQRVLDIFPKVIEGQIVGIADGDTVTVLTDRRRSIKIRLKGIDAPERGQDYSKRSKAQPSAIISFSTGTNERSAKALSEKIFGPSI